MWLRGHVVKNRTEYFWNLRRAATAKNARVGIRLLHLVFVPVLLTRCGKKPKCMLDSDCGQITEKPF